MLWKEAPESAVHSVSTGCLAPVVLNACVVVAGSHPLGQVGCWLGRVGGVEGGAKGAAAIASMATGGA
jgi:hypothetical protein